MPLMINLTPVRVGRGYGVGLWGGGVGCGYGVELLGACDAGVGWQEQGVRGMGGG